MRAHAILSEDSASRRMSPSGRTCPSRRISPSGRRLEGHLLHLLLERDVILEKDISFPSNLLPVSFWKEIRTLLISFLKEISF